MQHLLQKVHYIDETGANIVGKPKAPTFQLDLQQLYLCSVPEVFLRKVLYLIIGWEPTVEINNVIFS